ncbi:BTB/POZ domain-containing protein At1g67900-like [Zingiber officinale]|nr:BTB/POZ domain-containing protein At1g67900-like [Zingiber officinale]XP_042393372.1 BTB/POZ domain-containing protein At1g67900-like [Zingiber officinale]XP_042393373.1 BTB/POZ domain-containing protein At1g67900-like [Zingiber officinale]
MRFMKLGARPDTFFTAEAIRSVSSEVSTDLQIQVQKNLYHLHQFPLLSKCLRLQKLYSELKDAADPVVIHLPDFPSGAEAFELCAKFCYGITITLSPLNLVPVWCAAHYLCMSDAADRSNLLGKLDVFFNSILRRWKDTLVTLQSTRRHASLCEEVGITSRCVDSIASTIIANSTLPSTSRNLWADDLSELGVDHYWRIMVAVKSASIVSGKLVGEALQVYAGRWLPMMAPSDDHETTIRPTLLMEKIVSLLPSDKGSISCGFLLQLLKAANFLHASASLKTELARRIGLQLEEASVDDLLIPPASDSGNTLYDVDLVMIMLEEFLLQWQSPATSPLREKLWCERRRSRSTENVEFELQENSRRSSSASHSSKLRVAKLIDGYLQEIARDKNLTMEKLIAAAEAVPEFARINHDDLYGVIDIYLRSHPELDKTSRKQLCRILDCKKLSVEACMHAAQNELLPLRVVVQVLFFEQSRAAMSGCQVTELPSNIQALLAKTGTRDEDRELLKLHHIGTATPRIGTAIPLEDGWNVSRLKCPAAKLQTLKMKLSEDDNDIDDDLIPREALLRTTSLRLKAFCSLPKKPKKIISKLLAMNRSSNEKHRLIS